MAKNPLSRGSFEDWAKRAQVFKSLHHVTATYTFSDDKGLCTNPGKHQDNPMHTIYFHDCVIAGGVSSEYIDDNTIVVKVDRVEREIFGAMPGCNYFEVVTDDNGFVYGHWINQRQLDNLLANVHYDREG